MTTLALALVVLVAFVVEAAAGFGGTVVSVSLGAQLLPVDDVLVRFLPANLVLSLVMVARTYRLVEKRVLFGRIVPFMGAGMVAGGLVARVASPGIVKVVFAAFVLVLAARELRAASSPSAAAPSEPGRSAQVAALTIAGILHGMFACGGPMCVWVVGRALPEKGAFRATLSALWVVLNGVLVVSYAATGKLTGPSLRDSAILLVPVVLGLVVGERVHARLSPERFRVAVFGLLAVSSLVLLVRSLLAGLG